MLWNKTTITKSKKVADFPTHPSFYLFWLSSWYNPQISPSNYHQEQNHVSDLSQPSNNPITKRQSILSIMSSSVKKRRLRSHVKTKKKTKIWKWIIIICSNNIIKKNKSFTHGTFSKWHGLNDGDLITHTLILFSFFLFQTHTLILLISRRTFWKITL